MLRCEVEVEGLKPSDTMSEAETGMVSVRPVLGVVPSRFLCAMSAHYRVRARAGILNSSAWVPLHESLPAALGERPGVLRGRRRVGKKKKNKFRPCDMFGNHGVHSDASRRIPIRTASHPEGPQEHVTRYRDARPDRRIVDALTTATDF